MNRFAYDKLYNALNTGHNKNGKHVSNKLSFGLNENTMFECESLRCELVLESNSLVGQLYLEYVWPAVEVV